MIPFQIKPEFNVLYTNIRQFYHEREFGNGQGNVGARNIEGEDSIISLDDYLFIEYAKPLIEAGLEEKFKQNPDKHVDPKNVLVLQAFGVEDINMLMQGYENGRFRHNAFFHHLCSCIQGVDAQHIKDIKHIIVPIRQGGNHITCMTISLNDETKKAKVRYKDSLGAGFPNDIPLVQIKGALEKVLGYEIESANYYQDRQQREGYNCGYFTIFNAVDLVNHGDDEIKMPTCHALLKVSNSSYKRFFYEARAHAVKILNEKGFKFVKMHEKLKFYVEQLRQGHDLDEIEMQYQPIEKANVAYNLVRDMMRADNRIELLQKEISELESQPDFQNKPESKEKVSKKNIEIKNALLKKENLHKELRKMVTPPPQIGYDLQYESTKDRYFNPFAKASSSRLEELEPEEEIYFNVKGQPDLENYQDISAFIFVSGLLLSYSIYAFTSIAFSGVIASVLATVIVVTTGSEALSYLSSCLSFDNGLADMDLSSSETLDVKPSADTELGSKANPVVEKKSEPVPQKSSAATLAPTSSTRKSQSAPASLVAPEENAGSAPLASKPDRSRLEEILSGLSAAASKDNPAGAPGQPVSEVSLDGVNFLSADSSLGGLPAKFPSAVTPTFDAHIAPPAAHADKTQHGSSTARRQKKKRVEARSLSPTRKGGVL